MPAVRLLVSLIISCGSLSIPLKASTLPYTSQFFSLRARLAIPRITAFKPGQSPPPVRTNAFFIVVKFNRNSILLPLCATGHLWLFPNLLPAIILLQLNPPAFYQTNEVPQKDFAPLLLVFRRV